MAVLRPNGSSMVRSENPWKAVRMNNGFDLAWIDYAIMLVYFTFVIGIGWSLRRHMSDATAFLEAGRSMPAWVAGIAFISTSLGALEVMGMIGCGAKYG